MPNVIYTIVLLAEQGKFPQSVLTELSTQLMEVYRINRVGGSGSRKRVSEILLRLGIHPNE